ncbi:MAG: PBP1A family penicillin-binding protein [Proteobacteria bacterium]|nr:PBP1A family penicillin-binding protein [Pseudomonadota bacterium]
MTSPPPAFRADLRHARSRRTSLRGRVLITAGATFVLLAVLLAAQLYQSVFVGLPTLPDRAGLWSLNRPPGFTFMDHDGRVIATRGPRHGRSVDLRALPAYLPQAFLAAEDRRFYEHHGVDGRSILRAVQANAQAGGVVQGGSTLTQQLAKIIFLTPEQTFRRKMQEAVLAVRLERVLTKDEVLALYLDRVFFGENAYGVEAASQTFFGKSATEVTLAEAALLASLPKAPTRLDPTNDLDAAIRRSRLVLANMREEGWITAEQEALARAAPPEIAPSPPGEGDMGYVLDLAQAQALDRLRQAGVTAPPDLLVRLTVDPALQAEAAGSLRAVMGRWGGPARARQAALVALAPDGGIRAMAGGLDHRRSPFNRAVQAQRQPGSAFKPFVYAAAMEDDVRPTDIRQDRPVRFGRWTPANYGDIYRGAITVEDALAHSVNTVAIQLAADTGREKVAGLARRFGLSSVPPRPGLSVALGAYETNLLELTGAYQVFQRGGKLSRPYLIEQITTARGDLLYRHASLGQLTVYSPPLNAMMVSMMQRVIEQGTGRRGQFGRPAAGKTGTSQNHKDAWFVGFTPDWIAGVWVGNDDGRPMNQVTGGELPALIWRRFMIAAHEGLPVRDLRELTPLPEGQGDAVQAARSDFYSTLAAEFEGEAGAGSEPAPAGLEPLAVVGQ